MAAASQNSNPNDVSLRKEPETKTNGLLDDVFSTSDTEEEPRRGAVVDPLLEFRGWYVNNGQKDREKVVAVFDSTLLYEDIKVVKVFDSSSKGSRVLRIRSKTAVLEAEEFELKTVHTAEHRATVAVRRSQFKKRRNCLTVVSVKGRK